MLAMLARVSAAALTFQAGFIKVRGKLLAKFIFFPYRVLGYGIYIYVYFILFPVYTIYVYCIIYSTYIYT